MIYPYACGKGRSPLELDPHIPFSIISQKESDFTKGVTVTQLN
jgi:hypothetical protein